MTDLTTPTRSISDDRLHLDFTDSYDYKFDRSLKKKLLLEYGIRYTDREGRVCFLKYDPENFYYDNAMQPLERIVDNRNEDFPFALININGMMHDALPKTPLRSRSRHRFVVPQDALDSICDRNIVADLKIGSLESATLEYATYYWREYCKRSDGLFYKKSYAYRCFLHDDLRVIAEKYEGHTGHRSWK